MSGGSMGIRSGSNGDALLQQHQKLQNGAALPISSPFTARKMAAKMMMLGTREKERRLQWIWKALGSRKVGMFFLLLASAAVLLSFVSVVDKGPVINFSFSDHVIKVVNGATSSSRTHWNPFAGLEKANNVSNSLMVLASNPNKTGSLVLSPRPRRVPKSHPCENFTFPSPPPPADNKRTGPRPCHVCYVPVKQAVEYMPKFPSVSPILKDLSYVSLENFSFNESSGGSYFGGQPSLQERSESFDIQESMRVHCGFVNGRNLVKGLGLS